MITFDDLIGIPYLPHGRAGDPGLDCYGLVKAVFARCGVQIPEYDADYHDYDRVNAIYNENRNTGQWQEVKGYKEYPVLLAIRFGSPKGVVNHVGAYIGNGKFIHTRENTGVLIENVYSPLWQKRIEGAYRYVQGGNNQKPVPARQGKDDNRI